MLYRKTNENNSLLAELKSFCIALILVSTLFYIGLNSCHFNHNSLAYVPVIEAEEYKKEFIPQLEICRDVIGNSSIISIATTANKKTNPFITINTQIPLVKSVQRHTRKLKIKAPETDKPPTGLSSSFKASQQQSIKTNSVKEIKTPVTSNTSTEEIPILGISKPYTLNESLFNQDDLNSYNNMFVQMDLKKR